MDYCTVRHSATHVVGKAPTTGVSVAAPPEAVGGPIRGRLPCRSEALRRSELT